MSKLFACLLFVISIPVLAQQGNNDWRTYNKNNGTSDQRNNQNQPRISSGNGIVVHQSSEIQQLSIRFKQEHQGKADIVGYRVQVFVGERGRANEIKAKVAELYPGMHVELTYWAPNFRVRVGNFRTNLDADAFLRQVKGEFNSGFIVKDDIQLPEL